MDEQLRKRFATNLKAALEHEGRTQADMARYMHISTATASDWCSGNKMPRADKLQSLSNWLNVELSDLLVEYKPAQIQEVIVPEPYALTAEEAQLLADYRALNDDAQFFFRIQIHEFAQMDKYKKAAPAETA